MKQYYTHNGKEQEGPFTIEQLQGRAIMPETLVWFEGANDWARAIEIPELRMLFNATPPPLKSFDKIVEPINVSAPVKKKSSWRLFSLILGSVLLIYTLFRIFNINSLFNDNIEVYPVNINSEPAEVEKTPEQLRMELLEKEKLTPTEYVYQEATWRKNLLGEFVLEGSIRNSASIAQFKDIVFEIEWMSATNTVISKDKFTVYQVANPGESTNFKYKIFGPDQADRPVLSIVSAIPFE